MGSYFDAWRKVFTFDGRARRREYAVFLFGNLALAFVVLVALSMAGGDAPRMAGWQTVVEFGLIITSLAITVRRFHDIGKGGLNVLWWFVPVVDIVFGLMLLFQDGVGGDNKYGPNPKSKPAAPLAWMSK
jgi:uncharacterized membrane protein YhaH (DUF805 family)